MTTRVWPAGLSAAFDKFEKAMSCFVASQVKPVPDQYVAKKLAAFSGLYPRRS